MIHSSSTASNSLWRQGELVELTIVDLSNGGDGVGKFEGRAVFVPDTVVGDRLLARLVWVKPQYAQAKLHELLEPSPHRVRPSCIVADKCGGCQWQQVDYAFQLEAKRNLLIQDLERIGGFKHPPVDPVLFIDETAESKGQAAETIPGSSTDPHPHHSSPYLGLQYRNKATYPIQRSPSGRVQAGYYQKGSHHLVNLNQCPIQDPRLNPLLAEIKGDIQWRRWEVYDEKRHQGEVRHLSLRVGRRTGEILLTLVARTGNLPDLETQAQYWLKSYPDLVGILLNINSERTNAIFGSETRLIAGQPYLWEVFAGLEFRIHPTTFFQVNTEQAEALLQAILEHLNLQGHEVIVDAYCGIGTLTLPLAQRVKQAIALEIQPEAIEQARLNGELNGITNVSFYTGAVEDMLQQLDVQPDIVLVDPPRKGCNPSVIQTLLKMRPPKIVYVSCNPATLARDLKGLCAEGVYRLTRVQPADFFPQTAHVECAAFLEANTI